MTLHRLRCDKCSLKIPKQQPKLKCSICEKFKHLSCQKLTKADARNLIHSNVSWSCQECISDILPINACKKSKISKNGIPTVKFKVKCSSCNGYSYTPRNVRTCDFCDNKVHAKCWNWCCENIFPGFHTYTLVAH